MDKNKVIDFINQQDKNIDFYKKRISELETQLDRIKAFPIGYVLPNPLPIELNKESYNSGEINAAYQRAVDYEGIRSNEERTILITFLEFLNKTHHSLNAPSV